MIGTVTLNPAIDKTMAVPGFVLGGTNRGRVERVDLGGKGINVARAARQFGCAVWACGFLAACDGGKMVDELTGAGIASDFIYVPGETRVNLKIRDELAGTETEINEPGFRVGSEHLARLEQTIIKGAGRCRVIVFSGSLPPGVPDGIYADLIRIAKKSGARTILDTGGCALRIGLSAHPELVKPNRAEAAQLLGTELRTDGQLVQAAAEIAALGAATAVVSAGGDGAVAADATGCWRAWPPHLNVASSIAAGDSMVAALAYSMLEGMPLSEALRLAVAAGTATAAMEGTSVAGRNLIDGILARVTVEEAGKLPRSGV